MLSRLLSLTLIVAVLDCPLICGLAPTDRAEDEPAKGHCACCHHGEAPAEHGSAPRKHSQDEGAVCQCICNGALVDHAAVPVLGVNLDFWSPAPVADSLLATSNSRHYSWQAAYQPDDGMNPGRAMRCLFMSYLC